MSIDAPQLASALARLVPCAGGNFIALPAHTTLELVEHPRPVPVPGAPSHAHGLLQWQGKHIPLVDIDVLVGAAHALRAQPRYALVLAYQPEPGAALEHGALALDALPQTVSVSDDQACEFPQGAVWPQLATACFRHEDAPVPVLDTARLFV